MRKLKIRSGETLLVDDEDYNTLKLFTWSTSGKYTPTTYIYKIPVSVGRFIMKARDAAVEVVNINGNWFDYRKENLRVQPKGTAIEMRKSAAANRDKIFHQSLKRQMEKRGVKCG